MNLSRGESTRWILLAALMGVISSGYAQMGSAAKNSVSKEQSCIAPPAMAAKLRAHPSSEAYIALGGWFATRKELNCAVDTFRTGLKADPKSAQLHYLEGLALVGQGHNAEAIPALQEASRLEPQVLKPHLLLAFLYDHGGKEPEAEVEWKKALAIDPREVDALEGLSTALLAREDYVGVVQLLQSAPRTEMLSIALAKAFGLLHLLDQAHDVLTAALKENPGSVPLACAMSVVLVKQVRHQDAVNLLQDAVDKNPGNPEAELQLFRLLVLTNHTVQAQPLGPKLLAKHPHDPELLYLNGLLQRILGDYPQAKVYLTEAVSLDPDFANSRFNLGMALVALREWRDGKEQLEKAIALGATEPQVHFELFKALRGLGETERAQTEMKLYQQRQKADEALLEARMNASQGDKDMEAAKLQDAILHYKEAVQLAPDSADYKFRLAIALDKSGDADGERVQLDEALKIDPQFPGAQRQLALMLRGKGDGAGAIQHLRLAVQASPAWTRAWISLAAVLAENSRFAEAREAVATALRLDPANARARELSDELDRDPAAQQGAPAQQSNP